MTTEVYKNFLPSTLAFQLYGHILNKPHMYGHTSHYEKDKDLPRWYKVDLMSESFLCRSVLGLLIDKTKLNLSLIMCYANIQYAGQNGSFHIDNELHNAKTGILMLSPTLPKGSGTFEIKVEGFENKIETHDFEFNKLLFFKSNIEHKGNAPLEPGLPRITLAIKTEMYSQETNLFSRINNITNRG